MGNSQNSNDEHRGPQDMMNRYPEYQPHQIESSTRYGAIQLFRNPSTGDVVSLHTLAFQNKDHWSEFKRTIELYSSNSHPNLCKVLDSSSTLRLNQAI